MFFFCFFLFIYLFFPVTIWIVSHLVFYITFASNFQRLLVVYNIWIVTTFRFFTKSPDRLSVRNIGKPQVAFLFAVLLFMSIFPFITPNLSYLQSQTFNIQKIWKTSRGTQRLFSVKYLFGEANIA